MHFCQYCSKRTVAWVTYMDHLFSRILAKICACPCCVEPAGTNSSKIPYKPSLVPTSSRSWLKASSSLRCAMHWSTVGMDSEWERSRFDNVVVRSGALASYKGGASKDSLDWGFSPFLSAWSPSLCAKPSFMVTR